MCPGLINIVSNDGSNVVLTFPTGSAEGQYALSATTGVGVSPVNAATQFVVQPAGPQNIDSTPVSVLNTGNYPLPAGINSSDSTPVSVLNWRLLAAGLNSSDSAPVSVLNIGNYSLAAGLNSYDSGPVSVWNNGNYVLGVGQNFAMALPVSVCAPPQCTVNQSMMAISLMAHNSANAEPATTRLRRPPKQPRRLRRNRSRRHISTRLNSWIPSWKAARYGSPPRSIRMNPPL